MLPMKRYTSNIPIYSYFFCSMNSISDLLRINISDRITRQPSSHQNHNSHLPESPIKQQARKWKTLYYQSIHKSSLLEQRNKRKRDHHVEAMAKLLTRANNKIYYLGQANDETSNILQKTISKYNITQRTLSQQRQTLQSTERVVIMLTKQNHLLRQTISETDKALKMAGQNEENANRAYLRIQQKQAIIRKRSITEIAQPLLSIIKTTFTLIIPIVNKALLATF